MDDSHDTATATRPAVGILRQLRDAEKKGKGLSSAGAGWVGTLVGVCLASLGCGLYFSTRGFSEVAELAGYYLIYAVMVWMLFRTVLFRKRGAALNAIAFIAIHSSFVAGGLVRAKRERHNALHLLASMQRDMARVGVITSPPDQSSPTSEGTTLSADHASGEAGAMEAWFSRFTDRVLAQRKDYNLEIGATGLASVLDPERLKSDSTFLESRAILKRARVVVDKYEAQNAQLLQQSRASISTLKVEDSTRQKILAGFDKSMTTVEPRIIEMWKLQRQIVAQVEGIVDLLSTRKGWVIENGKVLFSDESDLARFNGYLEQMKKLTQQEEQIQEANRVEAARRFDGLDSAAHE